MQCYQTGVYTPLPGNVIIVTEKLTAIRLEFRIVIYLCASGIYLNQRRCQNSKHQDTKAK